MINIVRVYDKQVVGTHREYCGRPGKGQLGLLGNPFVANVDHSNRDLVCDQFQKYFELQLEVGSQEFKDKLNELVEIAKTQDIELACFCQSPKDVVKKRCHTETIKAYIEQQLEESKMKTNVNEPIGIIRPVVNQMDCIPSFRNELAFLSNMFEYPINNFKCAEAYYQAHKVAGTEAYTAFLGLNGYEAKRLGKQVELRSDWNEVKLSIIEKILRAKFQGELLNKLLAVKGEIVERNNWGDSYWGVCNGKGENHLGKLLMKIRDENVKQQIPSMTYAGIGSRSTPLDVLQQMANIAFELRNDFVLYSGAADGADKAFSEGTMNKVEFIPWKGFNNCFTGIVAVSNEAMELAATLHPAWDKLTQGAKKLMARNCHQILGEDLNSPVDFVICWTPDGAETKTGYNTGGTGQAIRLANRYGIPVINMFNADWKQRLDVLLEDIHILNQANQISLSTY